MKSLFFSKLGTGFGSKICNYYLINTFLGFQSPDMYPSDVIRGSNQKRENEVKLILISFLLVVLGQSAFAHEVSNCLAKYKETTAVKYRAVDFAGAYDVLKPVYSEEDIEDVLHMLGVGGVAVLVEYQSSPFMVNLLNPTTCELVVSYPLKEN